MNSIRGLLGVFLLLSLAACSFKKKESNLSDGESVKVLIPFPVDGTYSLQVVELFSLKNLDKLQGLAAKFLIDPDTIGGRLQGRSPALRYIRDSEGVIVAKDDLSLQLLTVYAHFEKLQQLEKAAGAGGVLEYPRKVAINVQMRDQNGVLENTALYSGQHDAVLMVPYVMNALPVMANAGVIAHEHFHALFQKLIIEKMKDKYPEPRKATGHNVAILADRMGLAVDTDFSSATDNRTKYHAALLRGINEGFADVWGWIYSGDNIFVGRSLPHEKMNRELSVIPDRIYPAEELLVQIETGAPEGYVLSKSYEHGAQLARVLRNFASMYGNRKARMGRGDSQSTASVAKAMISTLPELKKAFESLKEDELFSLSQAVNIFVRQFKDMGSEECYFVAKLMVEKDRQSTKLGDLCKSIEAIEAGSVP